MRYLIRYTVYHKKYYCFIYSFVLLYKLYRNHHQLDDARVLECFEMSPRGSPVTTDTVPPFPTALKIKVEAQHRHRHHKNKFGKQRCWSGERYQRQQQATYAAGSTECVLLAKNIIIIIINRRSGITSHTSHGHKTGTRSMQPVRSVPLGGPVVS